MEPIQIGPEPPYSVAIPQDNSPGASPESTPQTQATLEKARGAAQGQARFARDHEYQLLKFAYGAVRRWKREGVGQEIERELRAEAQVPISRMSSLSWCCSDRLYPASTGNVLRRWPLLSRVLMIRRLRPRRLAAFLWHDGGIEGAARQRASAVRRASSVSR